MSDFQQSSENQPFRLLLPVTQLVLFRLSQAVYRVKEE